MAICARFDTGELLAPLTDEELEGIIEELDEVVIVWLWLFSVFNSLWGKALNFSQQDNKNHIQSQNLTPIPKVVFFSKIFWHNDFYSPYINKYYQIKKVSVLCRTVLDRWTLTSSARWWWRSPTLATTKATSRIVIASLHLRIKVDRRPAFSQML